MKKIAIATQPSLKRTESRLGYGLLFDASVLDEMKRLGSRFALFCDERIAAVIGKPWHAHLQKNGLDVTLLSFPAGEKEKSRERKAILEDRLLSEGFGRDTCIIALGGGVVTDLVGFLASTYCRGVPLILVPTTLLGMVDAAIGGKTGVNTQFGKNLIGTFYSADRIYIDPETLSSLPPEEWTNGIAEVIKYALIHSPQLYQMLRNWNRADAKQVEMIIHECVLIKAQVVEMDFEEKLGLRRILNFGHTIAHAIETIENYQLSHGEAVAIGMIVESFISVRMGYLTADALSEIEALIRSFPFSLKISRGVTREKMLSTLLLDKKSSRGAVRFVLLQKIGSCHPFNKEYCTTIPEKTLDEALSWMFSLFSGESR